MPVISRLFYTNHPPSMCIPLYSMVSFVAHCMTQITVTTQNHVQVLVQALLAKILVFSFQECSCKQDLHGQILTENGRIQGLSGGLAGWEGFSVVCQPLFLQKKRLQHFPISAIHRFMSYTTIVIVRCPNVSCKSARLCQSLNWQSVQLFCLS